MGKETREGNEETIAPVDDEAGFLSLELLEDGRGGLVGVEGEMAGVGRFAEGSSAAEEGVDLAGAAD